MLVSLGTSQQEESHAFYWKPSELPQSTESIGLGGDPTTTASLNPANSSTTHFLTLSSVKEGSEPLGESNEWGVPML